MRRGDWPAKAGIFLIGAAIGGAAALLFAPKSGAQLRDDITDGANDAVDEVRKTGRNLRKRARQAVDLAKERVNDAIEEGEEAYHRANKV